LEAALKKKVNLGMSKALEATLAAEPTVYNWPSCEQNTARVEATRGENLSPESYQRSWKQIFGRG
jgi:hypothetical protein